MKLEKQDEQNLKRRETHSIFSSAASVIVLTQGKKCTVSISTLHVLNVEKFRNVEGLFACLLGATEVPCATLGHKFAIS